MFLLNHEEVDTISGGKGEAPVVAQSATSQQPTLSPACILYYGGQVHDWDVCNPGDKFYTRNGHIR